MKRNVILMGGKTHVISLPAQWVKQNGIIKGQELEVEHESGKVVIHTDSFNTENKAISIEISKDYAGKLIKAYQLGYNEIKLIGNVNMISLQETINNLLFGFEIASATKEYCMLNCISDISSKDFDGLFRRIFLLMSGKNNLPVAKLINMCKRCISKTGYGEFNASLIKFHILCELERVILNNNKGISTALQEIYTNFTQISYDDLEELKLTPNISSLANSLQSLILLK